MLGRVVNDEFHRLCLSVGDRVDRDGGACLILHGAYVAKNVVTAKLAGGDHTSHGKLYRN